MTSVDHRSILKGIEKEFKEKRLDFLYSKYQGQEKIIKEAIHNYLGYTPENIEVELSGRVRREHYQPKEFTFGHTTRVTEKDLYYIDGNLILTLETHFINEHSSFRWEFNYSF